jgi:hypothetical protein
MKNDAFHIMWYVNLYLYMDLKEFEINTIQYDAHINILQHCIVVILISSRWTVAMGCAYLPCPRH